MDTYYLFLVNYMLGCVVISNGEYDGHAGYEHAEQNPEREDLKTLQVEHIFKVPLHLRISKSDDGEVSYERMAEPEPDTAHKVTLGYSDWAAKEGAPTRHRVLNESKRPKKMEAPPSILSLLWPWYSKEQTSAVDQPKIIVERESEPPTKWQPVSVKRKRPIRYRDSKKWKGGVTMLPQPWQSQESAWQPEMSRPHMKEYIDGMGESRKLPPWAKAPWQPSKTPWQPSKTAWQPSTAQDIYKEPQGNPHHRKLHYPEDTSDVHQSEGEAESKDIPKVSCFNNIV